jgi:hypothetical protein
MKKSVTAAILVVARSLSVATLLVQRQEVLQRPLFVGARSVTAATCSGKKRSIGHPYNGKKSFRGQSSSGKKSYSCKKAYSDHPFRGKKMLQFVSFGWP